MPSNPSHTRAQPTIADWIGLLRSTAARTAIDPASAGKVGPIGFLRAMGADPGERKPSDSIDELLWMRSHVQPCDGGAIRSMINPDGPIHAQSGTDAIELWTERELSALHALWRLAARDGADDLRERALGAARWHIGNTQPDNATNHPWAIPVFIDCWRTAPDSDLGLDARLYAETLLHNCRAQNCVPDQLSALILLDAADGLSMLEASG